MQNRSLVVLLFGGENAEANVSVASAQHLLSALPTHCELLLLFWRPDGVVQPVTAQQLRDHVDPYVRPFQPQLLHTDSSFRSGLEIRQAMKQLANWARSHNTQATLLLGLHGIGCEDGQLQQILEQEGLAFTGSGSRAAAVAFDKVKAKQCVKRHGILTAQHLLLEPAVCHGRQSARCEAMVRQLLHQHGSLVMKPVQEGSSVGLRFLHTHDEVADAVQIAGKDASRPMLLEPKLSGIELTVSVLQDATGDVTALPCTQIKAQAGRCFDYAGKYLGDGVQEITPAQVPDELAKQAQHMAIRAHQALGCRGYSRTDCMATSAGVVFLEINTLPGLSPNSLLPQQLHAAGIGFEQFVAAQLRIAQQAVYTHNMLCQFTKTT